MKLLFYKSSSVQTPDDYEWHFYTVAELEPDLRWGGCKYLVNFSLQLRMMNLGVESSNLEQEISEDIPNVGMKFDSEDEIYSYYNNYAYQMGQGVRILSTRTKGDKKYYALRCHKGGVYEPKSESNKPRKSSKIDCKAKISVIVDCDGKCTISGVCFEHNHALSPKKSRYHRSQKKIDPYSKRRLELNDSAGISIEKNFSSLVVEAEGYENLTFDERDCRNYIAKVIQLRLGKGDAEALRDYFVRMQKRSTNFFYMIDMDDEGHLKNVFWGD
ncbi:protein FAR1-RELATED SEQUENCE 6-like [Rutidosis leptorrhynchoides]|uniref:protein FAR1-RELATED SEQUENCE 6-like n=1 Tax=Rutidosis leptorrhynchoides TaxID=125765 RepID=UPI003A98F23C